jgi:hypothetical protein
MDFKVFRGSVSGSTITWGSSILLGYTAANSGSCGSGGACAAVTAATDTNGYIYAAFRWLSGGSTTYSYRIVYSTDAGLDWSFLFSQVDSVSSYRPAMTIAQLSSGNMLFVYALYDNSELTYRVLSGPNSWTSPSTTSGAGMTVNSIKHISSASDTSNNPYVMYLSSGNSGNLKDAKWTNTGTFSAFETADSTLSHTLPSAVTIGDGYIHVYTFSSGLLYETLRASSGWVTPSNPDGVSFNSPDQLTSGMGKVNALWVEGTASPYNLEYAADKIRNCGISDDVPKGVEVDSSASEVWVGVSIGKLYKFNTGNCNSPTIATVNSDPQFVEKSSNTAVAFTLHTSGTNNIGIYDPTKGTAIYCTTNNGAIEPDAIENLGTTTFYFTGLALSTQNAPGNLDKVVENTSTNPPTCTITQITFPKPAGGSNPSPEGIAYSQSQGVFFITDQANDRLYEYNPTTSQFTLCQDFGQAVPWYVAVDDNSKTVWITFFSSGLIESVQADQCTNQPHISKAHASDNVLDIAILSNNVPVVTLGNRPVISKYDSRNDQWIDQDWSNECNLCTGFGIDTIPSSNTYYAALQTPSTGTSKLVVGGF